MADGGSDVLRVNAAGILAKTTDPDMLDAVALATRCRRWPTSCFNRRDSGDRWCAAWLLGQDGSRQHATR